MPVVVRVAVEQALPLAVLEAVAVPHQTQQALPVVETQAVAVEEALTDLEPEVMVDLVW